MPLALLIGIGGVLVTTLAIAARVIEFDANRPFMFLMALLQVGVLVVSVVFLGPVFGPLIAVFAGVGLVVTVSSRRYLEFDKITASAAVYWQIEPEESRRTVREVHKSDKKAFGLLGLTGTAILCQALAERARDKSEVMLMAKPIALLSAIFDHEVADLASRFDQLLRSFGEKPESAMRIADVLTRSAQITPGSFDEVLRGIEDFNAGFEGELTDD